MRGMRPGTRALAHRALHTHHATPGAVATRVNNFTPPSPHTTPRPPAAIPCTSGEVVGELSRGVRMHLSHFIKQLEAHTNRDAQRGLAHSYSRAKVKFNVNRVDNMIIQVRRFPLDGSRAVLTAPATCQQLPPARHSPPCHASAWPMLGRGRSGLLVRVEGSPSHAAAAWQTRASCLV